ncbi:hypothetical protein DY000_02045683 [Brassica cretica]|uniref:3'-5' exonuclease domain-containing protein n=1 Tax=Brassica cretica TaxID=69181 RepID=A0ABQ7EV55_BRACR|nr:hypothetical protein DY000_02045683 [Brassica cretica]
MMKLPLCPCEVRESLEIYAVGRFSLLHAASPPRLVEHSDSVSLRPDPPFIALLLSRGCHALDLELVAFTVATPIGLQKLAETTMAKFGCQLWLFCIYDL